MPAEPIGNGRESKDSGARKSGPSASPNQLLDGRLVQADEIRLSQVISALSVALDVTQGHPQGHSMRTGLIGMRIADELHLSQEDRSALYYALLLKDLGCSSNAAKIAHLLGVDDHQFKWSLRLVDWTKPVQKLSLCWSNCAPDQPMLDRIKQLGTLVSGGSNAVRQISEARCDRGAHIARMLRLPESTAIAIRHLDEHWNGRGTPSGLKGEEISLLGRICCLAQTVEVFHSTSGLQAAMDIAKSRRGSWFDPEIVQTLDAFEMDTAFWNRLRRDDLISEVGRWEPEETILLADEACLNRIAEAFALVVDAKSPWTYQHSTRVAEIVVGMARQFGCSEEMVRDLRRCGLLHDIGKLGVSNRILDKPGKPTEEEFRQIQRHAAYSHLILQQVEPFREMLAEVAAGHHEQLDGCGYHRGIAGNQISFATRLLTVADMYEAMSALRPYRKAMEFEQIDAILTKEIGLRVDGECVAALRTWHDQQQLRSRVEEQLDEVERLQSGL